MKTGVNTLLALSTAILALAIIFPSSGPITGMAAHANYPSFSTPEQGFTINNPALTISDDVIYKTGWYSINGNDWQSFQLLGTTHPGDQLWLTGEATYTLPATLASTGEHYVIAYSCSYNQGWDCHGNEEHQEGYWQLHVINNTASPNPILSLWCGFHAIHTAYSDGTMSITQSADSLKAHYDCGSTNDHDVWPSLLGQEKWTDMIGIADTYDQDGEFTYYFGVEWSGGQHIHYITMQPSPTPKYVTDNDFNTVAELATWLAENQGIAQHCHPARTSGWTDFSNPAAYNETWIPLVEFKNYGHWHWNYHWDCAPGVCTTYENPNRYPGQVPESTGWIKYALDNGIHLGFSCGNDYHGGLPFNPFCYTGVANPASHTRQGLYDALKARHTWVAEEKTWMDVRASQDAETFQMGDIFTTNNSSITIDYAVNASPGNTITAINLFHNGVIVEIDVHNEASVTGSFTRSLTPNEEDYLFIEAIQNNGKRAWNSPLWVTSSTACAPDTSCAATTCTGSTCDDGCGGTVQGTLQPDCDGRACGPAPNGCGTPQECGPLTSIQSCVITHGIGNRTLTCSDGTYVQGTCTVTSCDDGYEACGNACYLSSQSCAVTSGVGSQTGYCSAGTWVWNACAVVSCNNGYHQEGNSCVQDVQEPVLPGTTFVVDHRHTDILAIPSCWIAKAKEELHIAYSHTSHGSQIYSGLNAVRAYNPSLYGHSFTGSATELHFEDYYGYGDQSGFATGRCYDLSNCDNGAAGILLPTREFLDVPAVACRGYTGCGQGQDINVIMWSWCAINGHNIPFYIDKMKTLILEYENGKPGAHDLPVRFVFMTGHSDGGGTSGDVNYRNTLVRDFINNDSFCEQHECILFDFADIEEHDPTGVDYLPFSVQEDLRYTDGTTRNWGTEYLAAHPSSVHAAINNPSMGCSHSSTSTGAYLNCALKGEAAWHLFARMAGWNGLPAGAGANACP